MTKTNPRRNYPASGFFAGSPAPIPPRQRANIVKRGVPDAVLKRIEIEIGNLQSYRASQPPTKAEILAALKEIETRAGALLSTLGQTDYETMQLLRRRCDLLQPQPRQATVIEEALSNVLAAIYGARVEIKRWPKPTGSEFEHGAVAIVHAAFRSGGVPFDAKPNGLATLILRALLGQKSDVRYFIQKQLRK